MQTSDQKPETRNFYVGRRAFVEEFDAYGSVTRRWLTADDFGEWFVSDKGGDFTFKGLAAPTWAKMMHRKGRKDGSFTFKSLYSRPWAKMTDREHREGGHILDYAPPGFDGVYSKTGDRHIPIEENFYFMTLSDSEVIVAYDIVRDRKSVV